jgi:hypothetical protein
VRQGEWWSGVHNTSWGGLCFGGSDLKLAPQDNIHSVLLCSWRLTVTLCVTDRAIGRMQCRPSPATAVLLRAGHVYSAWKAPDAPPPVYRAAWRHVLAGAASRRNIACGSTSALSSLAVVCAAKRGIIHARPESSSGSPIGHHQVSFNPETTIETVAAQVGLSPANTTVRAIAHPRKQNTLER